MDSRSKILKALAEQAKGTVHTFEQIRTAIPDPLSRFREVLVSIGGQVIECHSLADVREFAGKNYPNDFRIYSHVPEVSLNHGDAGARYQDIDLAILKGKFAVAENGAVWITDEELPDRALPFITQHLMILVDRNRIVPTLAEAYDEIGNAAYEFGMFVAGPSKTADIEQSLVLGAHGPKTMTVALVG